MKKKFERNVVVFLVYLLVYGSQGKLPVYTIVFAIISIRINMAVMFLHAMWLLVLKI